MHRKLYPRDVRDEAWAFVAPPLTLMTEEAPQRAHGRRDVCNGPRWRVRAGAPWRMMPHELPPWDAVDQQTLRWRQAGVFEAIVHNLGMRRRLAAGRAAQPSAAMFDSRPLPSSPASGPRAGYDGAKRKRGSQVPMAVATLGHLLALQATPANAQARAHVAQWATQVPAVTGDAVAVAFVDQGSTGTPPAPAVGRRTEFRLGSAFSSPRS